MGDRQPKHVTASTAKAVGAGKMGTASGVVHRADLLGVLRGYNPWWSGRPADSPAFHRTAFYLCRKYLDDLRLRRAVLLSGPRRVGKTTILRQLAAAAIEGGRDPRSVCYLSLDHPVLSHVPVTRLLDLYHETIWPEGEPALLLLDEVQYSEQWDLYLKQLVDHNPAYRIAATGSASLAHRRGMAESGVGRWTTAPVPPLSFHEYLCLRGERPDGIPEDLRPEDAFSMPEGELLLTAGLFRPVMPLFGRYLLLGGYPEAALRDDLIECHRMLREDVIDGVLKRDMPALFNFRSIQGLENLFVYICTHTGGTFSATNCANALGSSKITVGNHLEALEQANLVYLLPPLRKGGKRALKAPPKVYLVDAALRNAVLLKGEDILTDADEMGLVVETAVLRHILSRYHADTPEVCYWREGQRRREVDFIVRTPKYTIPFEVKYRAHAPVLAKSGIAEFCRSHDAEHAYWVTQREQDFGCVPLPGTATKVLRIPAHILCYLLGKAERLLWTAAEA
jgi:predicted AAA+ superfamily ATPase